MQNTDESEPSGLTALTLTGMALLGLCSVLLVTPLLGFGFYYLF